ncbi:hypothetical protein [Piscirickettsia litoralis]|uniref:Uncharacterized protein n=1 Tax=Piscirickettsia litoralis TaxID=1891921 RepID=A0ABX3A6G5_9GAMM|nr:hypothetical protein [Piscirickettsia litoralis]ODN41699.1 hypothetical protein BGC07_00255 [Piscirickettsia litoralis]
MTNKRVQLKDHFWRYCEQNEAKITEFHEALKQGYLKLRSLDEIADCYQNTLEAFSGGISPYLVMAHYFGIRR